MSLISSAKLLYLTVSNCSDHKYAGGRGGASGVVVHDSNMFLSKHLNNIFSEVITLDYLLKYFDLGSELMNRGIVELVRKEKPQFVLWQSLSLHYEIEPATFQAIRDEGCKIIGIFWDDEVIFDSFSRFYIPCLDYYLTTDYNSVSKASSLGVKGYPFIPGADPQLHKKLEITYEYDVSFVGTRFLARDNAINELNNKGIKVNVFGNGWNRIVSLSEMVEIYNKTKINLNFTGNAVNKDQRQMKGRLFDVCMSGGFLLSEYFEGIERYYEPDKEIACFNTIEEAIEKINYYLSHDEEREEIAKKGYQRSIAEHSWLNRLTEVFGEIAAHLEQDAPSADFYVEDKITKAVKEFNILSSGFHLKWATVLLLRGNFDDKSITARYIDELRKALKYNPKSKGANLLYLIISLPVFFSRNLLKLYLYFLVIPLKYLITLITIKGSPGQKLKLIRDKLAGNSAKVSNWIE